MDYANLDNNNNRRGLKVKLLVLASVLVIGTIAALAVGLASDPRSQQESTITELAQDPHLAYKQDLFDQWKNQYYKLYTWEEEIKRFVIWAANYEKVQAHHKNPKHTFTIELNEYADLSPQEWKEKIGYCHKNTPITRNHYAKLDSVNIPASVDWRKKGAVTQVKNQLECGSCWAFSSTGSLEGLNFILNGKLESFSEQQLVDCSQNYGNNGCNGGLMDYAFEYVADKGIEAEDAYPYRAKTGICKYHKDKVLFKNKAYEDVPQGNNDALLAAVAQQPVSIGIEADTSNFQLYAGGVFNDASCGTNLDHGVLIVGYGTDPRGGDYWIVKNSWGGAWGENGFIRIARQSGNGAGICGIAEAASYPTGQNKEAADELSNLLDVSKMNLSDVQPEKTALEALFDGTPVTNQVKKTALETLFEGTPVTPPLEKAPLEVLFDGTPITHHSINPIIPETHEEEGHEEGSEEGGEEGGEEGSEEGSEEHAEEAEFEEIFVLSDLADDVIDSYETSPHPINPIIPVLEEEEGHEEECAEEECQEEENQEEESREEESWYNNKSPHAKPKGLADLLDAVQEHGL